MKLIRLMEAIGYQGFVDDVEITDIVYDSRKCVPGCLFVCLKGAASDGHQYAAAAENAGTAAIVCEEAVDVSIPYYITGSTRQALAYLSAEFFGHPAKRLKTIGITGTKGKTTTAFMIKSILEKAGKKVGVIGTIGVLIGSRLIKTDNTTPENYQIQKFMCEMADEGCDFCVMEVSSLGLKSYRVAAFEFDVGIFTNFSEDHIGGVEHKDMEEYLFCKSMLFKMCRVGCVNMDDESCEGILKGHTCRVTTYGFSENADIKGAGNRLVSENGFVGSRLDVSGDAAFTCSIGIPGKFNAYNALSAISACHNLGIDDDSIISGLRDVKVTGRVERVELPGNFTLLIDYAHNAVSMESLLTTLREYHPKRLVCMFGAGGNRPKVRRYEMGEVCGRLADLSVITADNSRFEEVEDIIADIKTGMAKTNGEFIEIPDRREAIQYCIENARDGDIIVLAGKGHEDYQEIKGVKYPFDERVVIAEILNNH